ncbi:tyrosinase family protein [Candidatus Nitrospira salsa]
MKKSYLYLSTFAVVFFVVCHFFILEALAACFPDLPSPQLTFERTEDYEVRGREFTRYRMSIANASEYPEELFAAAPQLPACGNNTNSSRTWLDILDNTDRRIYGFCAANLQNVLDRIWFARPRGEAPPPRVYVNLRDRECDVTLTSNDVSTTPVRIRRNISDYSDEQLNALRTGIEVMQSRSDTDPTSWIYQANIHGAFAQDGTPQPAWNSCQHGSWHFLAWHRMYLYYFERILRQASGDPNLTLPYWNYGDTNNPNARQIPLPYRQPSNTGDNPLYVTNRSSIMNNGGLLPESAVDHSVAFALTNFSSPAGSGQSFGGQRSGPGHGLSPHSVFEGTPHDVLHVNIGGWMGSFERAARDPIFWLHHTNIDRLWEAWLAQGNGRSNPTSGQGDPWLNETFTFFDETGATVTLTGAEIIHTIDQLNYRYDDQPSQVEQASSRQIDQKVLAKKNMKDIQLKDEPLSITLQLAGETHELVKGDLILDLEDVQVDALPLGHYEIYVNLPEGEEPNYKSEYYVGNMSFFGPAKTDSPKVSSRSFKFSLAEVEKRLKKNHQWSDEVRVTFIKTGPKSPSGQRMIEKMAQPATVQIGTMKIVRE